MEEDRKLRLFAVDSYVSLLQEEPNKLPQRFLQVISWVSLHSELCKKCALLFCKHKVWFKAWRPDDLVQRKEK